MNQYFRNFKDVSITDQDTASIECLMSPHNSARILDYHGYLDLKKTLRTDLSRNLNLFAKKLNLKVAGIYAFTANAGTQSLIHIDGDEINGPLPWRLSFYVKGEPGILTWHIPTGNLEFNKNANAYVCEQDSPVIFSKILDVNAAFVRTDIPHKLNILKTVTNRLTITATFFPIISWDELNHRLDLNGC